MIDRTRSCQSINDTPSSMNSAWETVSFSNLNNRYCIRYSVGFQTGA
jgi:hypothetical protein